MIYNRPRRQERTKPSASITASVVNENGISAKATLSSELAKSDGWYIAVSTSASFSWYTLSSASTSLAAGSTLSYTFSSLSYNTTYYMKVVNKVGDKMIWSDSYTAVKTAQHIITIRYDFGDAEQYYSKLTWSVTIGGKTYTGGSGTVTATGSVTITCSISNASKLGCYIFLNDSEVKYGGSSASYSFFSSSKSIKIVSERISDDDGRHPCWSITTA